MCNINIIMRKDGLKDREITNCMNIVSSLSYSSNKDGDGFFGDDFVVQKHEDKLIYRGDYSFIISHQRLSTSGKISKMTQPLETKQFIFVHNGIFRNVKEDSLKQSDTHAYLKLLEKEYKKLGDTKKAIKALNKKTTGYYSCILFNKKTKELYYYKEGTSSMYILEGVNYRLMSTKEDNVDYMRAYFSLKGEVKKVEDGKIYDLTKSKWKHVDTFEKYEYTPVKSNWSNNLPVSWTGFGKSTSIPRHTSTRGPINPVNINPQDLAYEFKESLLHNHSIRSLCSVCVKNGGLGDTYYLKISIEPLDTEKFEDLMLGHAEVEKTSHRKTIYTLSLKRAVEHVEMWEGVREFMEAEKMDLSSFESAKLSSLRDSETRYAYDDVRYKWNEEWWDYA